jgi:cardiolipin synthase
MTPAYSVSAHSLTLLHSGAEYFPQLIHSLNSATQSIHLESYIFAPDETGAMVSQALLDAALRGALVQLLLDGFGASDVPESWLQAWRAAGIQVLWFRPELARFAWRRQRLRRLHRKLVLVDERVAFIGGINIEDEPDGTTRLDYAVQVEGAVVAEIATAMRHLWTVVAWTTWHQPRLRTHLLHLKNHSHGQVQLLLRDNLHHRRDIERAYLHAIAHAQRDILIANAYFLPSKKFRRALLRAAERGVRVVLLLQGRVEYRLQHYATLALYDEMLAASIEIHEYQAGFLHAKVAVIDGQWATVGSSNIDPFSLWLAREANLAVRDKQFAATLNADLQHHLSQHARHILPSAWRAQGVWMRILTRLSYALVRLLSGVLGDARGWNKL